MNADDTPAAGKGDGNASSPSVVDAHARWQRTAVAAFFLAEARGFAPGCELDDWLAAERMIDASLIAPSVAADALVAATPLDAEPVAAAPVKRARKSAAKAAVAGVDPAPKKVAATARKGSSRTRKTKPGIDADLGGMA